jgi:hypothetical protein
MRKPIFIIAVFFIQFCANAQNWTTVGYRGEINPSPRGFNADMTNNKLFLWGSFYVDNVVSQTRIAELINGNDWQYAFDALATGPRQITYFQGSYYACPWQTTDGVAKWSGGAWVDAGTPTAGVVYNLYNDGDSVLWALGSFSSISSVPANYIAKFNGSTWTALDTATWSGGCCITEMCRYNGDIYFSGDFANQPKDIYDITRWDGTLFHKVGNGIHGGIEFVSDIKVYNNELYVGGWFWAGVNGNPGNMIAKWDGTQWYQVGGGMQNGQVNDLEIYNGKLWAAGAFSNAGGTTASMVATYDGMDWCDVGVFDISVSDLYVFNNEMYLCGNFQTIDGDSVGHVVKWIGGNNNNGCGHLNTGIDEDALSGSLVSFFPNPVITTAIFQFETEEKRTINIYDQFGREIWRKETDKAEVEFSAEGLANGMYFFQMIDEKALKTSGKFIVQH